MKKKMFREKYYSTEEKTIIKEVKPIEEKIEEKPKRRGRRKKND